MTMESTASRDSSSRLLPWLCALLVVFAVLAAKPFGNVAFGDDWSYAVTANAVAQTGHFRYTGWSTPAVGVDAYWAALLIRIFGYSYQVVRLSAVPFAFGATLLMFALCRRLRLSTVYSAFCTLTLMLTPAMIPLGACFLTDMPGMFFLLLTFYAEARALQAEKDSEAAGWLVLAALAGGLGGTIRQLIYFGAFTGLPTIAILRRRRRLVGVSALVLWLALCASMVYFLHWFKVQPNTENTPMSTLAHDWVRFPAWSICSLFIFLFTGAEFALPVALLFLPRARRVKPLFWIGLAVFIAASLVSLHHMQHRWNTVPYGNLLSYQGLFENSILIGGRPNAAPLAVFFAFTLATYVAWALVLHEIVPAPRRWKLTFERWAEILRDAAGTLSAGEVWSIIFVPFFTLYIWVIWARVAGTIFFDRYPIPLLPGAMIGILYLLQKKNPVRRVPAVLWALVVVLGLYGVAISHDFFALQRAEMAAGNALVERGIPRKNVSAGFEYDATTQSDAVFIMDRDAEKHASLEDPILKLHWYLSMLPVVQPKYFVISRNVPGLEPTDYPATHYRTWLPPFDRELLIGRFPDQQSR
ncbi:phospholipid carrier-dependent glycosyltransferase [Silvibacterium acidisoli]|uniref:phospholipid carrier-dependent glycosyltransferase n=1 Tax=Acidobacteriaceae bacterium ZG23-2 TaxID=2883246 RepID=UPI00406D1413